MFREARVLRPENDAEAGRPCEIQPLKPKLVPFAGDAPAKRQGIAGNERAALPTSDMAADIGRNTAEHRFDFESAFDCQVDDRRSGRRAYTDDLAAVGEKTLHRRIAHATDRGFVFQHFDGRVGPGAGQIYAVSLNNECRADIGYLQRTFDRRVADEDVGGPETYRIECAARGHAKMLVADPA